MTFDEFLKREVPNLGRPLTSQETVFLRAAEAAGFEMWLDFNRSHPLHFLLETIPEKPMHYTLFAGVALGTLEFLHADSPEIRATVRRLISEANEFVEEPPSNSERTAQNE